MYTLSKMNYHAPDIGFSVIHTLGMMAASDGITTTYYGVDGEPGKINEVYDGGSF